MDLLKNLVFIAALAVVAGGVYILLTNNSPPAKAPEGYESWTSQSGAPRIELPGMPAASASMPSEAPSVNGSFAAPVPSMQPPMGVMAPAAPGGNAPPFRAAPPTASIPGGEAPRFSPPASNFPSNNTPSAPVDPTAAGNAPAWPPSPASSQAPPFSASTGLPSMPPADPMAGPNTPAPPMGNQAEGTPSGIRNEFAAFMDAILKRLRDGHGGLIDAHERLSIYYANPQLTPEEDRQLTTLLDQIAGTVIYSRQHILEPAYVVQPGETLQQIAQKYDVPPELLAKINGIRDPYQLAPGQELKVVRGPFNAVIRLDRHELTMMLHGRYAGRFPIGIGQDQPILTGAHVVRDKLANPTYYGHDRTIDRDDPNNPLGERLIDLGSRVSLHGTNDPQSIGRDGGPGTIRLSDRDIDDVYDILTIGSQVMIQR